MPHSYHPESSEPWTRGRFVIGEGYYHSRVFMAGRNPGEVEKSMGYPFRGPAGAELSMYCLHSNVQRGECYLTNLYKYATPDDEPPTEAQFDAHWPVFARELALVRPQVLAVFGADANKYIFNKCGIEWRDIESQRSIPLSVTMPIQDGLDADCENDLPEDEIGTNWLLDLMAATPAESAPLDLILFPMTHPAAGIHAVSSMVTILDDFERLAAFLANRLSPRMPILGASGVRAGQSTSYVLGAPRIGRKSPQSVLLTLPSSVPPTFRSDSQYIAIDTEGVPSRPFSLQYCLDGVNAYFIKYSSIEVIESFKRCLLEFASKGGKVIFHNALYDLGMLDAMSIELPEGSFLDTMVISYLLGRLPQGLKPLSFRILDVAMKSYEDLVAPYQEALGRRYLEAAASIDWNPCRFCGAPNADKTEHPKGGIGAYPEEWFRKDGKTLRSKFRGRVEMCSDGLLLREVAVDKSGDPYFKRQLNVNERIQRALKDFSVGMGEEASPEPDSWEEMVESTQR